MRVMLSSVCLGRSFVRHLLGRLYLLRDSVIDLELGLRWCYQLLRAASSYHASSSLSYRY